MRTRAELLKKSYFFGCGDGEKGGELEGERVTGERGTGWRLREIAAFTFLNIGCGYLPRGEGI